jgi:DNA-binding SARP family transcriptional activator/TolA-binding protein
MSQLITLGRVRLVGADGVESAAAQPKRVALLTYVALASVKSAARRDALLALFWPELGDEEGRRALRQGLHYLRRTLGEDVFAGEGDELRLREGTLVCDAVAFERAIDDGHPEQALALYRGDFLEGFHVGDVASEYEEWVERTRVRLRRRASDGAWAASDVAERTGETQRALELARRACELEPDQEGSWRRLMTLHERVGDRAGALRAYDELAARLAREFDARPAPESSALAESIRTSTRAAAPAPFSIDATARTATPAVEPRVPPLTEAAPATPLPQQLAASAPRRNRTRALVALAAAVVLLGAGAFYYGTRDARAEPSLVGTGTLARKDRLLVADFADLASDSMLAAAVTEVLRVDLTQSPFVTVLTPRQVRTTLVRMERAANVAVDDSLAREVALRMSVKAFVTGSVAKVAGAYTVSVQLVAAQSGEPLAAYRETADDSTQLIAAVDRASKRLRHRIGESLRTLREMPPLTVVTTSSLAALRKYTEAQQLTLDGKRSEAIERYEQAIAIDSAFASAWSALAMSYGSIGNLGRSQEAGRRSIQYKHRLPFTDRSFIEAANAYGHGDYDTAIEVYRRLLDRYPDNYRALNNLALVYRDRREFATAESLFVQATRIDSTVANLYFGISGSQLLQGKFAEARRTLDLVARRFPGNPILLNTEMQLASAQHHWEEAERRAEALIAASQNDTTALVDPFEALALMASAQGRLEESERLWRTHQRLSAAAGSMGRHMFGVVRRAGIDLRYRNRPERALAIVDSALARMPLDSLLAADRQYDELARFNAIAGRVDRARRLAASADSNDRVLDRQQIAERGWTRGVLALAEGRAAVAEELLRVAAEQHECTICVLPDLARAYEANGKARAATAVYERYVATPWFWRYETDALELGPALEKLATLYEAAGERAKAAEARAQLVRLWRRADAALQPEVERARTGASEAVR